MRAMKLLPSSLSSLILFTLSFLSHPTRVRCDDEPVTQPIHHPNANDTLTPGSTFTITWTPNTHFANVTLELWDKTTWGYSRDFGDLCYRWVNPFCGTIASHAPNTGSFEWHIPKPGSDFPRGIQVFWIKMYVDDYQKPEINNTDPVLSYSESFEFELEPGQIVSGQPGPYSPLASPTHSYTETGTYPLPTDPVVIPSIMGPTNWRVGATMTGAGGKATDVPQQNTSSAVVVEPDMKGNGGMMTAASVLFSVLMMVL